MRKQGSKCFFIISASKKIFGKHFKVFHKLADTTNEFIKFKVFLNYLYFYVNMCAYICVLICVLQCICNEFVGNIGTNYAN